MEYCNYFASKLPSSWTGWQCPLGLTKCCCQPLPGTRNYLLRVHAATKLLGTREIEIMVKSPGDPGLYWVDESTRKFQAWASHPSSHSCLDLFGVNMIFLGSSVYLRLWSSCLLALPEIYKWLASRRSRSSYFPRKGHL